MRKLIVYIIIAVFPVVAQAQTLNEYLVMAAENNPGIKAKFLAYQAALEKIPQVGSLPNPELSFGYFILPVETRVGAQQMQFSIAQMFPWFGSLAANKDAATFAAKAKYEAFEASKNQLYLQVRTTYFRLWELEHNITLMEENLEILKSYESLATTKYENGKVGLVDVIRVQLNIEEAQNELNIMILRRQPLTTQFNLLLNRDGSTPVVLPEQLPEVIADTIPTEEVLVGDNPLLSQLDLQAQSYQQQLKVAKKAGMPTIGIGLNYTVVQNRTDMDVPGNGQDIFMPRVSVSLPLYRKKYNAMQNEAKLNMQSVSEERLNVQNLLTASFQDAKWKYDDAQSRLVLYSGQIIKSKSALNILITAYSSDNKDFEEVLRMQQQILKYEMKLVEATTDVSIAIATLQYITAQ